MVEWNIKYKKTHGRMKPAYGEIKCSRGANSVDCCVQEHVWMIARTVESSEQVMKPWIDYYVIVFSMVTEDLEWHGNLPNLRRGRTHDDMVKQLYACGSVAIRTETETELTCDTERNIASKCTPLLSLLLRTSYASAQHWTRVQASWYHLNIGYINGCIQLGMSPDSIGSNQ